MSIITKLFTTILLNQIECGTCRNVFYKFEDSYIVSLPLSTNCMKKALIDCFEGYVREENIPNFYCKVCQTNVNTKKKTIIWKLPTILILYLKKFKLDSYGRVQENKQAISAPPKLNLRDYVDTRKITNCILLVFCLT